MQIYIQCDGKTCSGRTFGEIVVAMSQRFIGAGEAFDLICELKTGGGSTACSIIHLKCGEGATSIKRVPLGTMFLGVEESPRRFGGKNTLSADTPRQYIN